MRCVSPWVLMFLAACSSPGARPAGDGPPQQWHYAGSSTVGTFMLAADRAYPSASFVLDTAAESDGGEAAILESACDLAGVAREPSQSLESSGVRATLIGRDAIAVIVHQGVGIDGLSSIDLGRVFRGEVQSWSELGGADLPVRPFVVAEGSATRCVLREQLLNGEDVQSCEEVRPDGALVERVAQTPGAIGAISFAFLGPHETVKALALDGQHPAVANFDYALARPLYLLWRPENRAIAAFVSWALGDRGQRVVMESFVGRDVRGSVQAQEELVHVGTLVVHTETLETLDGGVLYYPHRPYELLTRHGEFIRKVRNHRGVNDEAPTRVPLTPGIYLIRTQTRDAGDVEFFATVTAGRTTQLNVLERLGKDAP